jgi:heat shock protein HslJ
MDRQKQRMTLTAAVAVLVPLAAACGSEQADGGSGAADGTARPLTGVRWNVHSVTADGGEHQVADGAYLTIGADGRAEGSYGCNGFSAKATVDGDRVRLTDATATERACEDRSMAVERALARTLTAGPLTSDVDGDRLTLTAAGGDTVRLTGGPDAG